MGGGYFGKVKCIISPPLQGHINCLTILLHFPIDLDTSLMSASRYSDNLAGANTIAGTDNTAMAVCRLF